MFTYSELLNLDYRDLIFWFRQAEKYKTEQLIERINVVRSANLDKDGYTRIINECKSKLADMQLPEKQRIKEVFNELKQKQG